MQAEPQVQQPVMPAKRRAQPASVQQGHWVSVQRELSLQVPAQEPQVWAAQQPPVPQVLAQALPVQQPAASVPPWLPTPSLLSPPWPLLLPLLRRQLLPGYVCAPSPRRPRE